MFFFILFFYIAGLKLGSTENDLVRKSPGEWVLRQTLMHPRVRGVIVERYTWLRASRVWKPVKVSHSLRIKTKIASELTLAISSLRKLFPPGSPGSSSAGLLSLIPCYTVCFSFSSFTPMLYPLPFPHSNIPQLSAQISLPLKDVIPLSLCRALVSLPAVNHQL